MVRDSLTHLHDIGLFCGAILLLLYGRRAYYPCDTTLHRPAMLLTAVMMGLTAYSQFSVIPRIGTLRLKAGAAIATRVSTNPHG